MTVSEIMRSERTNGMVLPIEEDLLLKLAATCETNASRDSTSVFNLYVLKSMLGCRLARTGSAVLLNRAACMGCPWALYAQAMQLQRNAFKSGGSGRDSVILDEVLQIVSREELADNPFAALVLALAHDKGHAPFTSIRWCARSTDWPSEWQIEDKTRDPEKAFLYYKQAYDSGLKWPGIMCRMAEMVEAGDGVEKDLARACEMYLKFAPLENGDPWSDLPVPKYSFDWRDQLFLEDFDMVDSLSTSENAYIDVSDDERVDWCVVRRSRGSQASEVAYGGVVDEETILPYWILDLILPIYHLQKDCSRAAERVVEMRRDGIGVPISKKRDDACRAWLQYTGVNSPLEVARQRGF